MQKNSDFDAYMAHTIGSPVFYKHSLCRFIYTEGVQLMAEEFGAHWLLDVIGSYQPKLRREPFQVWILDEKGVTAWRDKPGSPGAEKPLVSQKIPYTDFPVSRMPFTLWFEDGTLMFPEER